jgi:hypothetical protein
VQLPSAKPSGGARHYRSVPITALRVSLSRIAASHVHGGNRREIQKPSNKLRSSLNGHRRLWHCPGHSLLPRGDVIGSDNPWAGWRWSRIKRTLPVLARLHRPSCTWNWVPSPSLLGAGASLAVRRGDLVDREPRVPCLLTCELDRKSLRDHGGPASPATLRWWLFFNFGSGQTRVHRHVTFFALPSALRRLRSGVEYG